MEIEMDALAPGDRYKVLASPDWYCRTEDQFEMPRRS